MLPSDPCYLFLRKPRKGQRRKAGGLCCVCETRSYDTGSDYARAVFRRRCSSDHQSLYLRTTESTTLLPSSLATITRSECNDRTANLSLQYTAFGSDSK